jgi:GGDEF domain-containing protein
MEFDPHTLHQIVQRIQQQMRCPQCGEKIPVDFASVRLTGEDFVLLQLKCDVCDAYIVLHASLQGMKNAQATKKEEQDMGLNASSSLTLNDTEMETLRAAIQKNDGSFESLFKGEK